MRRLDDPGSYARRVLVNRHRSLLRRAAVEARSLARWGPAEEVAPPAADERALVLWQAVLVARGRPEDRGTVAPAAEVVRVPAEGFQLTVPAAGGSRSS